MRGAPETPHHEQSQTWHHRLRRHWLDARKVRHHLGLLDGLLDPSDEAVGLALAMIVLRHDNTLTLIRQSDHAAMAANLARAWRRPAALPPHVWDRFLDAVARHDDGWIAAENKPALDAHGRPFDFKHMPAAQHLSIWRRSVDLASRVDAYACLLVAHHARYLYTHTSMDSDDGGGGAAVQAFINELAIRIVRCTEPLQLGDADERIAIDPRQVNVARRLLTTLDWLSLALLGALPMPEQTEPLAFADTEAPLSCKATAGGAVVSPWPFADAQVQVHCPAIDVPDAPYPSSSALLEAMNAQTPRMITRHLTSGDFG